MSAHSSRAPAGVLALLELLRRRFPDPGPPVRAATVLLSLPLLFLSCSEAGSPLLAPDAPDAAAIFGDIPAPVLMEVYGSADGRIQVLGVWVDDASWDVVSFTGVVDGVEVGFAPEDAETGRKPYTADLPYLFAPNLAGTFEPGEHEVCIGVMAKIRALGKEKATTHHNRACETVEVPRLAPPSVVVSQDMATFTWQDDQNWPAWYAIASIGAGYFGFWGGPYVADSQVGGTFILRPLPAGIHTLCITMMVGEWLPPEDEDTDGEFDAWATSAPACEVFEVSEAAN